MSDYTNSCSLGKRTDGETQELTESPLKVIKSNNVQEIGNDVMNVDVQSSTHIYPVGEPNYQNLILEGKERLAAYDGILATLQAERKHLVAERKQLVVDQSPIRVKSNELFVQSTITTNQSEKEIILDQIKALETKMNIKLQPIANEINRINQQISDAQQKINAIADQIQLNVPVTKSKIFQFFLEYVFLYKLMALFQF